MRGINAAFQPDPAIADAIAEVPEQAEEYLRVWKSNFDDMKAMKGG